MGTRRAARRALLARTSALLALPAIGCSLLIPLDYTGGMPGAGAGFAGFLPAAGGNAGQGGAGGTGESGGAGGQTGSGGSGGGRGGTTGGTGDEGPGGEAGTGATGGAAAAGGTAPLGGEGGDAGMAGAEGGMAGAEGGMGGSGGLGGTSGVGGSGGMGGCPGVDLETDPQNCGSCEHACMAGSDCIGGVCIDSPCQGLCAPAVEMPLKSDGYREDDIHVGATCHQVSAYDPSPNLPSIIAWNFDTGRTLAVNGVPVPVMIEPGAPLAMPKRAGGYCIQAGAGDFDWAGYKLPLPSPLKPKP